MSTKYFQGLPKKRMGAGALFFNESGELLILKPTYKDNWSIPGGVINENESPKQACIRETEEEIGLKVSDLRFICVDYKHEGNEKGESLQFIFYGGVLKKEQIWEIKIPPEEISEYKFAEVSEALPTLSHGLRSRMSKALEAIKNNTAFYLEEGIQI